MKELYRNVMLTLIAIFLLCLCVMMLRFALVLQKPIKTEIASICLSRNPYDKTSKDTIKVEIQQDILSPLAVRVNNWPMQYLSPPLPVRVDNWPEQYLSPPLPVTVENWPHSLEKY